MALTTEDGTGVTGADSFVTAAEFAALEAEALQEAALRRAWVYMSALSWRDNLWATFGGAIPDPVKAAQAVLARAEAASIGALSPSVSPATQKTLTKVGDIGWTAHTADIDEDRLVELTRPINTMAMDLLKPYLSYNPAAGGNSVPAVFSV